MSEARIILVHDTYCSSKIRAKGSFFGEDDDPPSRITADLPRMSFNMGVPHEFDSFYPCDENARVRIESLFGTAFTISTSKWIYGRLPLQWFIERSLSAKTWYLGLQDVSSTWHGISCHCPDSGIHQLTLSGTSLLSKLSSRLDSSKNGSTTSFSG